jgi:hypothetical protein
MFLIVRVILFISKVMKEPSGEEDQLPMVRELMDVFPKELPRLPQTCEITYIIDLIFGSTPISIAPYRLENKNLSYIKMKL